MHGLPLPATGVLASPESTAARSGSDGRPSPLLIALLVATALIALLGPVLLVRNGPRTITRGGETVLIPRRVVPATELPKVDPVELQAVDPDDARAINAAIAFSTKPNPAARPFRIDGAADSRARAVDCLAAAVYYEAGDDAVGERAVAQVVLNRVRHPAFPKTVCGVVFQGSERSTGCQFTFTCDGALLRYSPTPVAWQRAREIAIAALNGTVYRPVGHATHYHTDWVVPYWSASLEKITAVHTHLFYRWAGWWGTPPAFNRGYIAAEPSIAALARLSSLHKQGSGATPDDTAAIAAAGTDPASIPTAVVPGAIAPTGPESNIFLVTLDQRLNPDAFAALAIRTCGERPYCKFMAWSDPRDKPTHLPATPAQIATLSFSYLRDQPQGFAKALWNCQQFKRPSPVQCMRSTLVATTPTARDTSIGPAIQPAVAVDRLPGGRDVTAPLTGIRRKPAESAHPTIDRPPAIATPTPVSPPSQARE